MKNPVLKFILFSLIFQCAGFASSFAQGYKCGTEVSQEITKQMFETRKRRGNVDNNRSSLITMTVQPHIIRNSNGSGGLNPSQLFAIKTKLNNRFAQANITFIFCPTVYHNNTNWQTIQIGSLEERDLGEERHSNKIDIFFIENTGLPDGWGWLPEYKAQGRDWIVMRNSSANTNIIAHEMGHYLGLLHTHETINGRENVERAIVSTCYNCHNAGDGFCTTAADFNLLGVPCVGPINAPTDNCGQTYNPDRTNLMSYIAPGCLSSLSTEQIAEVRTVALTSRNYIYASCSGGTIPNCNDGLRNQGEFGVDCGGPCIACNSTPNNDGISFGNACPTGNISLNCGLLSTGGNNGTVTISHISVTNGTSSTIKDLYVRCTLVGGGVLGTEPASLELTAGATGSIGIVFWYSQLNLPDGDYPIKIELLDAGTILACCESTSNFVIGNGGGGGTSYCTDGVQNNGETGVDCGGNCAPCGACNYWDGPINGPVMGDFKVENYIVAPYNAPTTNIKTEIHPANGPVGFYAGRYIELRPGFYARYNSVFKAEIKECVSNVNSPGQENSSKEEYSSIISDFNIYPNPFAQQTTIELTLDEDSETTILVTDMTGKVVATLVNNESLSQGNHFFVFDGARYGSGMYFSTIIAGKYSARKKMILMR